MIIQPDINKELFIKRIPFLKKFKDNSTQKAIGLYAESYNTNVKYVFDNETVIIPNTNYFIDFTYIRSKINDNYFFNLNIDFDIIITKPKEMNDLLYRVILIASKQQGEKLSLHKEIISKKEHLTDEELSNLINEANKIFFQIDDFMENIQLDVKNPLNETFKPLILEKLHKLTEDITLPQDYSKEFNQTGSGKSIQPKRHINKASISQLNNTKANIAQAHIINNTYKKALKQGLDSFDIHWQGKFWNCTIPQQFKSNDNYISYFDYPELGDGGFQASLDKNGFIQVKHLKSKSDIHINPNLSNATDAGYEKEFNGTQKYFNIKAGLKAKDNDKYSIFPTPAIDAAIKIYIAFQTEIIDFMTDQRSYTSDDKGTILSNQMDLNMKLQKIKKDAEDQLNKKLSFDKRWLDFKNQLINFNKTPQLQQLLDVNKETKNFIEFYQQNKNPFHHTKKPEISLPKDELDNWEKQQKEKLARLAIAKARMKK